MKAYGLLAALLGVSSSWAGSGSGITVTHFEPLHDLTWFDSGFDAQQKIEPSRVHGLRFEALGGRFALELQPNDRMLGAAARKAVPANVALYRGRDADKPGSWARISLVDGEPQGLIWDGTQMLVVEAPGDGAVQSAGPVIYRLADTYVAPGMMTCGAAGSPGSGAAMYSKLLGELSAVHAAPGATMEITLSAIGDFEFFEARGENAEAAILTRLNNVDGIFSEQLGVQITVATTEVHSEADDPFSDTEDSGDLLDELGIYRRDSLLHRTHGLTHLYTGRNLETTTVGIAYVNALCSARFGAGLTEGRSGVAFDSLVSAHEIGHNFGAPHDAEEDSACEHEPEDFLMAASLNGSDQFSQCSIAQIQPRIAAAQCISALPTIDMTVSHDELPAEVLLGAEVSVSFVFSNAGSAQATDVMAEIVLPDRVDLVSAAASAGTCTSGAGRVDCELGSINGGENVTVTVTAVTTDTGSAPFSATVTAASDDNAANDGDSVTLEILDLVDLLVNTLATAEVALHQSTTVRIAMDNRSGVAASGVGLSISLGNGLRAESATWSLGACTVSEQQVDCEGRDFAGLSAATADLTLTGTASGQRTYTVTLSSTETDANEDDNSATGTVTVMAAVMDTGSGGAGGGGGGAFGQWFLVFLAGTAVVTRYRRAARLARREPC